MELGHVADKIFPTKNDGEKIRNKKYKEQIEGRIIEEQ